MTLSLSHSWSFTSSAWTGLSDRLTGLEPTSLKQATTDRHVRTELILQAALTFLFGTNINFLTVALDHVLANRVQNVLLLKHRSRRARATQTFKSNKGYFQSETSHCPLCCRCSLCCSAEESGGFVGKLTRPSTLRVTLMGSRGQDDSHVWRSAPLFQLLSELHA